MFNKEPEDHIVYGDWRDIRGAFDRAYPEFQGQNIPRDQWNMFERVLAKYNPIKGRCFQCNKVFSWSFIYRCYDCDMPLCKPCMKHHFGPQHRPHLKCE